MLNLKASLKIGIILSKLIRFSDQAQIVANIKNKGKHLD